jgi:multiple sugar transport system permease protein
MKQTKTSILIFMGPAVLLFMLVFAYPVIRTSLMSLFNVQSVNSAVSTWSFTGIGNYSKLFNTRLFLISLGNIGKIWLFCGIATLGLGLILAIILTQGIYGQKFFRAAIYLPNVIAAVAVGYMWLLYVFNNRFGLMRSLFTTLGMKEMAGYQWLSAEHMFLSMCIAYVFSNTGYFMLMYIAGIEKISLDYYEAATIEGANVFQKFFHITLPLLSGVLGTSLVLWTTKTMGFFALSQVFSNVSTITPMVYTYQTLFGSEISADSVNAGVAAASAVVMTVVVMAVSMISKRTVKDEGYEL